MKLNADQRMAVADLVLAAAMLLDRDKLEDWLGCFARECSYSVMPRENRERNLPIAVIGCPSRAVLTDRVTVLRQAAKFNPHYDRHILGPTQILVAGGDSVTAETNFTIVQTTLEGTSKLFVAGCYEDSIVFENGDAKLKNRVVLLDTFAVPNLIATPL